MRKKKRLRFSNIIFISILGYFVYILFIYQQNLIDLKTAKINEIETKIKEENANIEVLKEEKDNLNNDEYIDKLAREKLGMVKKDERIFIDINK